MANLLAFGETYALALVMLAYLYQRLWWVSVWLILGAMMYRHHGTIYMGGYINISQEVLAIKK